MFVGVCIDRSSLLGSCGEHAAAAMLTAGQNAVMRLVAISPTAAGCWRPADGAASYCAAVPQNSTPKVQ